MHDVNWWLMILAFVLGLLLTFAMMIRRVTREVPITHTVSAAVSGAKKPHLDKPDLGTAAAAAAAKLQGAADRTAEKVERVHEHVQERVEKVGEHVERVHEHVHEHVQERVEKVGEHVERVGAEVDRVNKTVEKAVEKTVQKVQQVDVIEQVPYGGGSIRVTARTVGPAGYSIKADKDTGRYFTPDSPEYADIEAEVWFANEASAQKAGFLRWDAKDDQKAGIAVTETLEGDASAVRSGLVGERGDLPYGKGSSWAGSDGSGPAGWLIKGNADSGLYHGPESPYYGQTIAEVWFIDEATATAAGFKKWDTNIK